MRIFLLVATVYIAIFCQLWRIPRIQGMMGDMAHSDEFVPCPPAATMIQRGRKREGLTQGQLADRLGALGWDRPSATVVYKIESGLRPIGLHELAIMATALNCTMAYLTGEADRRRKPKKRPS